MTFAGNTTWNLAFLSAALVVTACEREASEVGSRHDRELETFSAFVGRGPVSEVQGRVTRDCPIDEPPPAEGGRWQERVCVWEGEVIHAGNDTSVTAGELFSALVPCAANSSSLAAFITYAMSPEFSASCWTEKSLIGTDPFVDLTLDEMRKIVAATSPPEPAAMPVDAFLVIDDAPTESE